MKKKELKDKVAIITGAGGGIGREIVKLFDQKGIQLVLSDINEISLKEVSERLSRSPLIIRCDITDNQNVKNLISQTISKFNRIDLLINTVGIIIPALFEDIGYEDIEKQIQVNLMGTIRCTKEAISVMKKSGGGNIVTISSLAGIVPETYSSIYTASKFALRGLNLTLNLELKKYNITISTIFPDSVDTPMLAYEAKHGGSPLTFLNDPIKPEIVAKKVLKAIIKNKPEIIIPRFTGILSKLIMCFPKRVLKMWKGFEEKGIKKKQEFIENLERSDGEIN
ncbi:MAG: SDR family oxidoreductase [Promethearchaeota archaeon]|nr:MAG: SDR family oxidoreductase [Candidatus Lokiarchaeota archaeon]